MERVFFSRGAVSALIAFMLGASAGCLARQRLDDG